MIIKDYMDLSYFNWKFIKENKDIYHDDKEKLVVDVDISDIETAMKEEEITCAH